MIQPLEPRALRAAAALLTAAFHEDPAARALCPDPRRRCRWLERRFHALLLEAGGEAFVAGSPPAGLALWTAPGGGVPLVRGARGRAAIQWTRLTLLLHPLVALRSLRVVPALERLRRRAAGGPHLILVTLAVSPERRRRGIGAALLRDGLRRADALGLDCYLETAAPENLAFYGRFGFEVAGEACPSGGALTWALLRRQHPGAAAGG